MQSILHDGISHHPKAMGKACATHLEGHLNPREQVRDDVLEQLNVSRQELGQVAVPHGPDQHHILSQVGLRPPQTASHDQHRLDSTHAEVIVVLLAQLLTGQLVQLHHLARQRPAVLKTCQTQPQLTLMTIGLSAGQGPGLR